MYIKVEKSVPIQPFNDQDNLKPAEMARLLSESPTIDLRNVTSQAEVVSYLQSLIAHYFQIPAELVTPEADLIDDIERHIWARELDVPFEEVDYGRILCGKDEEGNPTGGLSDRGLLMSVFMVMDLANGVGVSTVDNEAEATIEAEEDEFGSFFDCRTINELANILEAVRVRLPQ
ncbi:hypothetical protein [Spongorhabdus nitratireducens]